MLNSSVLVLNQNYEPLNVCRARRAVVLIWRGKAEVLENDLGVIQTPSYSFPLPSVIRIVYAVKRPRPRRRLTRREVFIRDRYQCQYCGKETRDLTLDHVIPRFRGGKYTWENVVSACRACNRRKAGHIPKEAGMRLLRQPSQPHVGTYYIVYRYFPIPEGWRRYLPQGDYA